MSFINKLTDAEQAAAVATLERSLEVALRRARVAEFRADRAERELSLLLDQRRADIAEVSTMRHALAGLVAGGSDPEPTIARAFGPKATVR